MSVRAADDLAKATDIARDMVMRYGMDESLGHVMASRQRRETGRPAAVGGRG